MNTHVCSDDDLTKYCPACDEEFDAEMVTHGGTFSNALPEPMPAIADLRRTILTWQGYPVRLYAHAWFTRQAERAKWWAP